MFASNATSCTVRPVHDTPAAEKLPVQQACAGWLSLVEGLCALPIRAHNELALRAATALDAWLYIQEAEQRVLSAEESSSIEQLREMSAYLEECLREKARSENVVELAKTELLAGEEADEEILLFTVQLEHLSYYDPVMTVTDYYTRRRDARQRLVVGPRWLYQIVQFSASMYAGRASEAVVAPHSTLEQDLIVRLWDASSTSQMGCLASLSAAVSALAAI